MSAPSIVRRHPALRWLVPVGVLGVLGIVGIAALSVLRTGTPTAGTPQPRSARALVTALRSPARAAAGYSGTVVTRVSLGLPALAALPGSVAADGTALSDDETSQTSGTSDTSLAPGPAARGVADLLTGPHALRYWYGDPAHQRVALMSPTDESDVFLDGPDLWVWTSADRVATHSHVDPASAPLTVATLTPQQLAARTVASIDASTDVALGPGGRVADRPADVLVVTPHDPSTRIGSVHISVDRSTDVPLAVQVFARGAADPAIDVGFAAISFHAPARSLFAFHPPAGATVTEDGRPGLLASVVQGALTTATVGAGWSSVVELHAAGADDLATAAAELADLPRVHGRWGTGRLAQCRLLSVLVTDDGRVLVGAVGPQALYRAAGR